MKLKKLATVFKRNKRAIIFDRTVDGAVVAQYVSDGAALYPLEGLPVLDRESLLTIFDVEAEKRADWNVSQREADFYTMNPLDIDETEWPIVHTFPPVVYNGKQLMLCDIGGGEMLIFDPRYISPVKTGEEEYYVRKSRSGIRYLTVKDGLITTATIMPISFTGDKLEQFASEIYSLADRLRKMIANEHAEQLEL